MGKNIIAKSSTQSWPNVMLNIYHEFVTRGKTINMRFFLSRHKAFKRSSAEEELGKTEEQGCFTLIMHLHTRHCISVTIWPWRGFRSAFHILSRFNAFEHLFILTVEICLVRLTIWNNGRDRRNSTRNVCAVPQNDFWKGFLQWKTHW